MRACMYHLTVVPFPQKKLRLDKKPSFELECGGANGGSEPMDHDDASFEYVKPVDAFRDACSGKSAVRDADDKPTDDDARDLSSDDENDSLLNYDLLAEIAKVSVEKLTTGYCSNLLK